MADKLTPEEVIKALECCITDNKKCNCKDCPYKEKVIGFCFDELNKDAIDLINRQQAELEEARIGVKSYKGKYKSAVETAKDLKTVIAEKQAEIERLQNEIGSLNKKYPCTVQLGEHCLMYARSLDDYDKQIGDISSEAIKEFTERLKNETFKIDYCGDSVAYDIRTNIQGLPAADVVPVEWISVKDRLPDEEERVLVAVDSDKSDTKIDTDRMIYRQWVRWGMSVTHWMPLPEPPMR